MLFEEWEKGTDLHDYDEYRIAEELYNTMPENFTKDELYKLREAVTKEHFEILATLVNSDNETIQYYRRRQERLTAKENFVDEMIRVLKEECKMDVLAVYASYMADKAQKDEKGRILGLWEDLENGAKNEQILKAFTNA